MNKENFYSFINNAKYVKKLYNLMIQNVFIITINKIYFVNAIKKTDKIFIVFLSYKLNIQFSSILGTFNINLIDIIKDCKCSMYV